MSISNDFYKQLTSNVSCKYYKLEQIQNEIDKKFGAQIAELNPLQTDPSSIEDYSSKFEALKEKVSNHFKDLNLKASKKIYTYTKEKVPRNKTCIALAISFFALAILAGITILVTKNIHVEVSNSALPYTQIPLADAYNHLIFNTSLGVAGVGVCASGISMFIEGEIREAAAIKKFQNEITESEE